MERPVKCKFCSKQMYYFGDSRHVAEVRVEVYQDTDRSLDSFYAHVKCWETRVKPIKTMTNSEISNLEWRVAETAVARRKAHLAAAELVFSEDCRAEKKAFVAFAEANSEFTKTVDALIAAREGKNEDNQNNL